MHAVIEKELRAQGTSRQELGREVFLERAWEWREDYGSQIVEQLKRLGASCDYERERFTLDEGYVRAVYRVFVALYEKGYIYRDNYMVNWDVGSRSVISELEVFNQEVTDTLYSIDYPIEGSERVADRRHRAPRDDARRHRGGRAPRRRALPGADRRPCARCRSSAGGCRSSPTSTSIPSSAPGR